MMLILQGRPKACKRPKFSRHGTYDPQKAEKNSTRIELKAQFPHAPYEGPIAIFVHFHFEPPKSTPRKELDRYRGGLIAFIKKPDIDNMIKYFLDCMNGIIFIDDSQVIEITAKKCYHTKSSTIIMVESKEDSYAID